MFNPEKVDKLYNVYYFATSSNCRIIYYEYDGGKWKKRLREISFSRPEIDPVRCVLTFKKIANSYGELLPFEPHKYYANGVYTYFNKPYEGFVTVMDMNSAYLFALSQPLPDWETKQECTKEDVYNNKYDFYCFDNGLVCKMFYGKDLSRMVGAMLWKNVKIFGFRASRHYVKTCAELYRLKCNVNKEKYKNIANIAIGCMHKRSGKQNNTTIAAGLYAWFAWYIDSLVELFSKKGYNVIMVTTDSIKIQGKYNLNDNLIKIGNGLGEFKIEYEGKSTYYSEGHYEEQRVKWKGKPAYLIDGYPKCTFIDNLEEEREVYEKYAITKTQNT